MFESNDDLPINKRIKLRLLTMIIRSVFSEDGKFYSQLFLDDALYELKKFYGTKKLMFQKELNKTRASKEFGLCHHWFFKDVGFKFEEHVCNKCHDLLTMAHSLKDIAILSAKGNTFRCLLMGVSKNKALKRLNNSVTYDREVL